MAQKMVSSHTILEDVEEIYSRAMAKGNFSVALKAKELLGKEQGLFKPKVKIEEFSLNQVSDTELSRLVKEVEKQLRLDPSEANKVRI